MEHSILPVGSDFFRLAEARKPIQEARGGKARMSYDASLWHLLLGDRIGLSAMVLAPSPDRSDVLYLGQGVIAERGSSAFLNKP